MFDRLLKAPDQPVTDLEARAASASSMIEGTLSTFADIVRDLEEAAEEHLRIAAEACNAMADLAALAEQSDNRAEEALAAASKIRGLLS